ncbi:enoyl-CoA hydratase/isomerase family protein [Occultella aeris]|uniref:6-oxocamphor hydrolase n=1 Tax=Occultella aeris TaxID=2761496 RepID=A0A7M4DGT1_9MICO|nr:enoyl-CoA hydratase/isomerase family protein [Occultella aeris]VZO36124.1 6-oxocamphor hydrolase [Occultella aeris]
MTDALSDRDRRLGNVVQARTIEDYGQRFQDHFALSRDQDGVLVIRVHTAGGTAVWSRGLLNAWSLLLAEVGADRKNEVVVITGTGEAWIGGFQPESFSTPTSQWHSDELDAQYADGVRMLERLVMDLEVPTIAVLNGPGPRQEIALLCDVTLCSPTVTIGDGNFAARSVPGDGMFLVLSELIGPKRAAYLAYTGARLTADQAMAAGVVNEILPGDQLLPRALEIAAQILDKPRSARRLTHGIVTRSWQRAVVQGLRESYAQQMLSMTR